MRPPSQVADLTGFAALRRVAESVNSSATVEYWKSVPYFINFMDGYQLADRVRDGLKTAAGRAMLDPCSSAHSDSTVAGLERLPPPSTSATDGCGHSPPTRSAGVVAAALGTAVHALLHACRALCRCVRAEHDQAADLLLLVGRADSDRGTAQL